MKHLSRQHKISLGLILLLTGFVILVIAAALPQKSPLQDFQLVATHIPMSRTEIPAKLDIPGILSLQIAEMPFGPSGWEIATNAASIASNSARPGENGNIVIYSHNLRKLFGQLIRVKVGDQITLTSDSDEKTHYIVKNRSIVNPTNIDALKPTDSEVLTLYTCTGLFDSKRLVLRAEPML